MSQISQESAESAAGSTAALGIQWPGRSLLALGLVSLLVDATLRLVLIGVFGATLEVPLAEAPALLLRGLLHDLVVLPGLLLPLAMIVFATPVRWRRSPLGRLLGVSAFFAAVFGRVYLFFVEYFFFEEFSSRLNLVAVDYLVSPSEVMVNIWDSYPVIRALAFTTVAALVVTSLILRTLRTELESPAPVRRRMACLGAQTFLAIALPSLVPLNVLATGARYEDQISFNGVHSFFEAVHTNELSYPDYYRMLPEDRAFDLERRELLRGGETWESDLRSDLRRRHVPPRTGLEGHNVVVIVEESLGCEHVGACGDARGLTPNLDAFASDGLFWSDAWATGTRTVRGLEAIVASLPPIPSQSIVKRPGSENIATWGQVMARAGYQTSFLYGGYGTFDNMNRFFGSNGFAVSDRREIDHPVFANIWGVSDEDLFRHALDYFDERAATGRAFFSVVLTTSNHKPFTFRDGVPGVPAQGGGRNAGVRYADFALGGFLRDARAHPWFPDTIFVVLGDHGSRVYGHGEIPMPTYRIPVVVFGDDIKPAVLSTPASQIDVAPTVLGLLGLPYTAPFFGRDVVADPDSDRPIFVSHNHDVGMLVGDRLAVLGLEKTSAVYEYDAASDRQTPMPYDRDLVDRATAAFESAYLLFSRGQYR